MCLTINSLHHPTNIPLIADKDITVWKSITIDNRSAYKNFRYKPNRLYKTRMKIENKKLVTNGFHSYKTRQVARSRKISYYEYSKEKVVKFIIPKGSKYFIGLRSEIVSNKIFSSDLEPN